MVYLVPVLFFLLEFAVAFLCFKFVLTKDTVPAMSESAKTESGITENSVSEKKSLFKNIKRVILSCKYSRIFTSLAFSVIAGVCGYFSVFYSNPDTVFAETTKHFLAYSVLSIFFLTDLKFYIIPNKIIIGMLIARLVVFIPDYFTYNEDFLRVVFYCFISMVICFIVLMVISFLSRSGIGMGDVKLFTALGFTLRLYFTFNIMLYSLVSCALFSIVLVLFSKKKAKDKIPFAPFIYIGFVITVVLGSF